MKLKEVLDKTTLFFKEKGSPSARLDTELLMSSALGIDRIRLYVDFDRPLNEDELTKCRDLVRRRGQGEPVAYILGRKDFFTFSFIVSPAVLIPRPETEHVVEETINWCKKQGITAPTILDLGCGSGCIGISILKNIPDAKLLAIDISAEALAIAQQNAEALGVADRAQFVEADAAQSDEVLLAESGISRVDVIVANPPYIDPQDARTETNVKKFEPSKALFAADHGLAALKAWTKAWAPMLATPGLCVMEMGNEQGSALKQFYADASIFSEVSVVRDLAGHDRLIKGVRLG